MNDILAIDPGSAQSAWVIYDIETKRPIQFGIEPNEKLLERFTKDPKIYAHKLAVEMISCYGMSVGTSVFDTCVYIGRLIQAWETSNPGLPWEFIYRKEEKMLLCNSMRANDSTIRQAIMDRYGSTRRKAIGIKKYPGPLYKIRKDIWAALAVAITAAEKIKEK